jgi:hypothetical protein
MSNAGGGAVGASQSAPPIPAQAALGPPQTTPARPSYAQRMQAEDPRRARTRTFFVAPTHITRKIARKNWSGFSLILATTLSNPSLMERDCPIAMAALLVAFLGFVSI